MTTMTTINPILQKTVKIVKHQKTRGRMKEKRGEIRLLYKHRKRKIK